jgi:hypothetical protein
MPTIRPLRKRNRLRNLIDWGRFDSAVDGKTDEQAPAIIGDAAARIAERAKLAGKPVVIEKLDSKEESGTGIGRPPGRTNALFVCPLARRLPTSSPLVFAPASSLSNSTRLTLP